MISYARAIIFIVVAIGLLVIAHLFGLFSRQLTQRSEQAHDHFTAVRHHDAAARAKGKAEALRSAAQTRIDKTRELGHASLAVWADRINRL